MTDQLTQYQTSNKQLFERDDSILNHLAMGIVLLSDEGLVSYSNSYIQKILGLSAVELEGMRWSKQIQENDQNVFNDSLIQLQNQKDKKVCEMNVSMVNKDSETIKVRLLLSQISSQNSKKASFMVQVMNHENTILLQDKLKEVKDFLLLISENNQDLVFVKDESFKIVFANKAFLSIYPEDQREQVIGSTTFDKFQDDDIKKLVAQDKIAFSKGVSKVVEEIVLPNGKKQFLETIKKKFFNRQGEAFILCVSRDVTKTINLLDDLERINADLNQFVYVASHDLKSPANAIRQIVDWIEEDCHDSLNEAGLNHLKLLRNRSNRMITLLDDLLQYSRFHHGNYETKEFNLKKMVSHIMELMNPELKYKITADDKNLIAPYSPTEIVLRNLIFNAIKHHDKPTGVIEIKYLEDDPKLYKLVVIDDGPGIAPDLIDKALEMFQTLQPRDQVEGSGMGLALVKKIVTSYKASLVLKNASEFSTHGGLAVEISWPRNTFI